MKNIILDSNIFIGAWYKKDQYQAKSVALIEQVIEKKVGHIFITMFVVLEVLNFLLKKVPFAVAADAFDMLIKTDRIHLITIDTIMMTKIEYLFKKYKNLSLTDCSLIITAQELGISDIYSFDGGFDRVKEIKRKEAII